MMWDDETRFPTKYYIIDAMGNGIFFRTKDRAVAQALSNEIYGDNKFVVKMVLKAVCR